MTPPTPMDQTPKPRIGVAGILRGPDSKILLGRRRHAPGEGLWAFPGGRLEWGEPLTEAVVREFHEETGLRVICGDPLYVSEIMSPTFHFVLIDFWVTRVAGELCAGSDVDALAWVGSSDLAEVPLAEGMARCLADSRVRERIGWNHA